MKLVTISSLPDLRRQAAAWDDLWWSSDASLPTLRAELLAQWVEHFAEPTKFVALAVEADGQFIAALPLVLGKKGNLLSVAELPTNYWAGAGDLLLDPTADVAAVQHLLAGVRKLPASVLWLTDVHVAEPEWQTFLSEVGARISTQHGYHVGRIDTTLPWDAYEASWSSNHRTGVKKSLRKLSSDGDVELVTRREFDPDGLQELLHQAFEIEDRSWKGEEGTSVLRSPGMFDFFLRQSHQLAEWGQLELVMLHFAGQPIAFEYCYVAKGVTWSHKIGYDQAHRKHGPGRLLRYLQLQEQFADDGRTMFDTMGLLCETKARWCTHSYPVSRVAFSTGSAAAGTLLWGRDRVWPQVKRLIGRPLPAPTAPPKLGAATALAAAQNCSGRDAEQLLKSQ